MTVQNNKQMIYQAYDSLFFEKPASSKFREIPTPDNKSLTWKNAILNTKQKVC